MRACDEHAKAAFEPIGGDPSFVRSFGVFATRDDGRFDALAMVAGESLDVEDRQGIRLNYTTRRTPGPDSSIRGSELALASNGRNSEPDFIGSRTFRQLLVQSGMQGKPPAGCDDH